MNQLLHEFQSKKAEGRRPPTTFLSLSQHTNWTGLGCMDYGVREYRVKPKHDLSRVRRDHPRCRGAAWISMLSYTRDVSYRHAVSRFHGNSFRSFGAS